MVDYPLYLMPGQKLPVYISDGKEEKKSTKANKIRTATITKSLVIKVEDMNDDNAKFMRHESKKDVIKSLKKWYKINQQTIITYLEFRFDS